MIDQLAQAVPIWDGLLLAVVAAWGFLLRIVLLTRVLCAITATLWILAVLDLGVSPLAGRAAVMCLLLVTCLGMLCLTLAAAYMMDGPGPRLRVKVRMLASTAALSLTLVIVLPLMG